VDCRLWTVDSVNVDIGVYFLVEYRYKFSFFRIEERPLPVVMTGLGGFDMKFRWFSVAFMAFGMALYMSCAADVGTIDRTQHDKLEKSLFAGVWYMTHTVVDTPFNAGYTFVGETNFGQTGKVIFDIQEDLLVVYPIYEYVEGSEKDYRSEKVFKYWDGECTSEHSEDYQCLDGVDNLDNPDMQCCFVEMYVGQPVSAFEIVSHFDVQREYNEQTGEQTNVLVENTTDRMWWQRDFIRVNWAINKVQDFEFMARMVDQKPVDYYVQTFETDNPDAPVLSPGYIDVVTKIWGDPESTGTCNIYGVSSGDCAPALIKFRTAFRKVDPNNDYEPLRFHNEDKQQWFGYFLTERYTYDEEWGLTDSGKISYIQRWNIWDKTMKESPILDEEGNEVVKPCFKDLYETGCDAANKDGAREFCSASDWFEHGECVVRTPLPYTQRGLRPIVFHASTNTPEDLWDATVGIATEWSGAFQDTVAWLYYWEEKGRIAGQASNMECDTDEDCAADALIDTYLELDEPRSLLPKTGSGKPLFSAAAKTLIVDGSAQGVRLLDWDIPYGDISSKAGVRFINLTGDTVDLKVGGSTLFTGVSAPSANDYLIEGTPLINPQTATTGAAESQTVEVAIGADTVASLDNVDFESGAMTLFVYTGSYLARSSVGTGKIMGLRVLNATDQAVDISWNAGIRAFDVQPGGNSGYQDMSGGLSSNQLAGDIIPQRVVAMPAGSPGDVTCYRTEPFGGETKGRCVGYKPEIDWDLLEEIKAKLPDMFVMCRNQYTPEDDDQWASSLYGPWTGVKHASVEDLTEKNPCLDHLYMAADMTDEEKLAQAQIMKKGGDSRYSLLYFIPDAQMSSPLGYGPSSADPDTGELFWGTANIYGAPLYTIAAMYRDLIDIINGNLDVSDYITGQGVRDYLLGKGSTSSSLTASQTGVQAVGDGSMFDLQINDIDSIRPNERPVTSEDILAVIRDKDLMQQLMLKNLPVVDPSFGKDRLAAIKGTPYEDMLITEEIKLAMSDGALQPGTPYTDEEKEDISPLGWATLDSILREERDRQMLLSRNNYCFAEFSDEGLLGLAKEWGCTPDDPRPDCPDDWTSMDLDNDIGNACCIRDGEKLAYAILQRYYWGVAIHEVGHAVGLRHNFEGSSDLFNFFDEYYDIREKEPIPCNEDDECETVFGQYCGASGYCEIQPITGCQTAADCGFLDSNGDLNKDKLFNYACEAGHCVALKSCGLHGECGDGEYCDGDSWTCFAGGEQVADEVTAPDNPVVRQFIPRAGLTPAEAAKSRTKYQYTSIMDYGQRMHDHALGLGKYDEAAIRFGYGQLMDVYEDTSHLQETIRQYAQYYGYPNTYMAYMLGTDFWSWGVHFSQFYFLQNYIGVEANLSAGDHFRNRSAVPYDWVKIDHDLTYNYYREELNRSFIQVPYKFCGDEYRGNMGCFVWDTGIDPLEIIHNFGIQIREYYILDAFKRERYGSFQGGDPSYYLSRITGRYMEPMQSAAMYYALFAHIFKGYGWRGNWANTRMQGWALRRAAETGFELLGNALASPAPGSFSLGVDNVYRNFSYDKGITGADLNVPLGLGKYPYTQFMDDAGYFYWDHALWIGSFWEKLGALMTLTDSTVYFTSNYVGEQLDIGVGTSMGYNTMYPRQLIKLFGGIVADEPGIYAWLEEGGEVAPRSYFDPENMNAYDTEPAAFTTPVTYDPSIPVVEPSISNLTLKLYTMLYGMAYLPASFDPSFLDAFAVCIEGNGDCYDISTASALDTKSFEDPFGGKKYLVWESAYDPGAFAPNIALVDKANDQKAVWESVVGDEKVKAERALRDTIATLDLMRGLWEIFGSMKI